MSKPFHVIGLTGPKGCGKDTVAELLRTHAGFYVCAFADQLRREVCRAYREEPIQFTRRETKEHPLSALALRRCFDEAFVARMGLLHLDRGVDLDLDAPRSPRQIMQWWGTEYRRLIDPDYWADGLHAHIHGLLSVNDANRIAVTDVRFENEAETITALGGVIWQVKRPGCTVPSDAHVSEVDGSQFEPTAVIDNNGDIRHLQEQVLARWLELDAGLSGVEVRISA